MAAAKSICEENETIAQAMAILDRRMRKKDIVLSHPVSVVKQIQLTTAHLEHEVFGVLFLTLKHRLIKNEVMFRGSLMHSSVYPREVIKAAMKHNAAFVIFYHNHPSGTPAPSTADITLTESLKKALMLVDVRVIDHIIVAGTESYSFAQHGLIS